MERKESQQEKVNPLEYYMREEMYPGMSEEVIEKLHFPAIYYLKSSSCIR